MVSYCLPFLTDNIGLNTFQFFFYYLLMQTGSGEKARIPHGEGNLHKFLTF